MSTGQETEDERNESQENENANESDSDTEDDEETEQKDGNEEKDTSSGKNEKKTESTTPPNVNTGTASGKTTSQSTTVSTASYEKVLEGLQIIFYEPIFNGSDANPEPNPTFARIHLNKIAIPLFNRSTDKVFKEEVLEKDLTVSETIVLGSTILIGALEQLADNETDDRLHRAFELLLKSWGLVLTQDGFTHGGNLFDHCDKTRMENKARWEQFAADPDSLAIFSTLIAYSIYANRNFPEWDRSNLGDYAYIYFSHSSALKRHVDYEIFKSILIHAREQQ